MTSETVKDEERKRRMRVVAFLQCNKRRITTVLLVGLAVLVFGVIPPSNAIISCNDPQIRREVRKDTITILTLFTVAFIVPFFKMLIVEWLVPPITPKGEASESPLKAGLKRSWKNLGDLFVGGLFMYFTTDLLKTMVGEARPCFWELCKPNLTEAQCSQPYVSVSWEDCTNPYKLTYWKLAESMKSFPSGHASVSVYSAVFMMAYTHRKLWQTCTTLLSPWLQLVWVVWAIFCCQSRVWNYRHYWWDVVAGAGIGALFAFLTLHYLSNWFEGKEPPASPSQEKEEASPSPSPTSSSSYMHEEEEEEEREAYSRESRTSIKRLITGGGGGGGGGGGASERELRNISSAP